MFLLQTWKNFNFQEVLIIWSCLTCLSKFTFLWKNYHLTCGEWEFYNIGQIPSKNVFMKVPIHTSVVTVVYSYRSSKPLSFSVHYWTCLTSTRRRVDLTRNRDFKMPVNLLESKLYFWKFVFLHSFGWGIRIYFHLSTKFSR